VNSSLSFGVPGALVPTRCDDVDSHLRGNELLAIERGQQAVGASAARANVTLCDTYRLENMFALRGRYHDSDGIGGGPFANFLLGVTITASFGEAT